MNNSTLSKEEFYIDYDIDLPAFDEVYEYDKWLTNGEIVWNKNIVHLNYVREIKKLPTTACEKLNGFISDTKLHKVLKKGIYVTWGNIAYKKSYLALDASGKTNVLINVKYADMFDEFDCFYYKPDRMFYFFTQSPGDIENDIFIAGVKEVDENNSNSIRILKYLQEKYTDFQLDKLI